MVCGVVLRALVVSVLLSAALPGAMTASAQIVDQERVLPLKAGDVITQAGPEGWMALKVIAIDTWPDGTETAHCVVYEPVSSRPDLGSTRTLPKKVMHAPIAAASFATGWERLGNLPVVEADREGFIVYLKHTDFPRYLLVSDQKAEDVVNKANRHYKQGIVFADAGDHESAITAYGKAIDLFPLFFEAIDNQGFSYMDIGRYDIALENFEQSLEVNPDGVTAFFSKGECLLRLGRLEEAAAVLKEARARYPDQRAGLASFAAALEAARRQ